MYYYQTDLGLIGIADNGQAITDLFFAGAEAEHGDMCLKETALIRQAAYQIEEYFRGKRRCFDLPLYLEGTPMQKAVWEALLSIPYGQTRSYKQIAEQIGRPRAYRAVGMANNRNPISIIVPCHRVIGANGKLVGYGGGLEKKQYLLDLERVHSDHHNV
ncbi:MAG: methylated-DNA--[protein]-cysteine S-methyltransferase [Syntrophomonadaceae bacterium]